MVGFHLSGESYSWWSSSICNLLHSPIISPRFSPYFFHKTLWSICLFVRVELQLSGESYSRCSSSIWNLLRSPIVLSRFGPCIFHKIFIFKDSQFMFICHGCIPAIKWIVQFLQFFIMQSPSISYYLATFRSVYLSQDYFQTLAVCVHLLRLYSSYQVNHTVSAVLHYAVSSNLLFSRPVSVCISFTTLFSNTRSICSFVRVGL
jgi:hypothetical protein